MPRCEVRSFIAPTKDGFPERLRRIGSIAVDPFDPQHVLVGGIGFGRVSQDNDFGGMYVTSDGGATWMRETFISTANYWCHRIVFDPATKGRVFATMTSRGMASGIYRSTDGGKNWAQLKAGLPSSDRIGRTSVAISSSNPRIIYLISDQPQPSE